MTPVRFDHWALSLIALAPQVRRLEHARGSGWGDRRQSLELRMTLLFDAAPPLSPPTLTLRSSHGMARSAEVRWQPPRPGAGGRVWLEAAVEVSWEPAETLHARLHLSEQEPAIDAFLVRPDIPFPGFLLEAVHRQCHRLGIERIANFVETGTLFGHTAAAMAAHFDAVYSIELSEALHRRACAVPGMPPNVQLLQGDSAQVIATLVQRLDSPTVFFLDAHWSGPGMPPAEPGGYRGYPVATAHRGHDSAPDAHAQLPLAEELSAILTDFAPPAIVIVDDWAAIGEAGRGWQGQDWRNASREGLLALIERSGRVVESAPIDRQRYGFSLRAR